MRFLICLLCATAWLTATSNPAPASVNAGAASWQIPLDVRAEGMGRAASVLDPGPLAARVNPGALGLVRGLEVGVMRAQLVPDFPGVEFEHQALVFGWPLAMQGTELTLAIHANRTWLSYGTSVATSPGSPDPIGFFESWEETYGGGFALGLGDWLGLGVGFKEIEVMLAPPEFGDGHGVVGAWSYGALLKMPPVLIDGTPETGYRLSASVGVGSTNHGDPIRLSKDRPGDPLPKNLHVSIGLTLEAGSAAQTLNVLGDAFDNIPLVVLEAAAGFEDDQAGELSEEAEEDASWFARHERTAYGGVEAKIAGIVSLRGGYIHDDLSRITNPAWGFGLEFPGRFGLDFASVPQFEALSNVHQVAAWVRVPW